LEQHFDSTIGVSTNIVPVRQSPHEYSSTQARISEALGGPKNCGIIGRRRQKGQILAVREYSNKNKSSFENTIKKKIADMILN